LIAYADTGFLVSLYGQDAHSQQAIALANSKPVFILTSLSELEFTNAMELLVFRKEWTPHDAGTIRERFVQHQAAGVFRMEPLVPEVWEKALFLSRRRSAKLGTRTLDVLHVATALVMKPDVFFSFNGRQRALAKAENLRTLPA